MADPQFRLSLGDTLRVHGLPPRGTQTHLAVQLWTPRSGQTGRPTCPHVAPESAGAQRAAPKHSDRPRRGPSPGQGRCRHLPFSQNPQALYMPRGGGGSTPTPQRGQKTLTQRKPPWTHVRTFCSVINTYRQMSRCEQNPRQSHTYTHHWASKLPGLTQGNAV